MKSALLTVAFGFVCALALFAQLLPADTAPKPLTFPPREGVYRILPIEAVDGDTVHFYWLVPDTGRLVGINAPETHGATAEAGKASKAFLETRLSTKPMTAKIHGQEKYGRVLLEIFSDDGRNLSQMMIDAKMAVSWDGKGPRP